MSTSRRTWFITGGTPGGFGMAFAETALESTLADLRAHEPLSRGADFPTGS